MREKKVFYSNLRSIFLLLLYSGLYFEFIPEEMSATEAKKSAKIA